MGTLMVACSGGAPTTPGPSAARSPQRFGPTGLDGAGFENVIAMAPAPDSVGQRPLVVGGDVSGYERSTDGGRHWQAADLGVPDQSAKHIASLAFAEDPLFPDKVYGLAGSGDAGGLMVSLDGGQSWTMRSTAVIGAGGNAPDGAGLPSPHPRSTGNLIVQDRAGATGYLWVGTFRDGVMRSTDDGATWPATALAGHYLRSLVKDPADPNTIYAASFGRGVWVSHDAEGAMTFSLVPDSPPHPEELVAVDHRLYVAAGADGVSSYDPATRAWSKLGAGQIPAGSTWQSIAGFRDPATGAVTVYAGCSQPQTNANGRDQSVFKSTDGGANWSPVTIRGVSDTVEGTTETWWHSAATPQGMIDGAGFVASQILIDPRNAASVYVAGRAGVWHSGDAGAGWQPVVTGLGATINFDVAADPNLPGRVYATDADWPLVMSSDGLAHVSLNTPKDASATSANAGPLALDPSTTPSTVFVGGDDGRKMGEIWSNADPAKNVLWQRQGLSVATGGKPVSGVAVGRVGGTTVILAAVTGSGVWRKEGVGGWSKVSPARLALKGQRADFSWVTNSAFVYLYDGSSGVWRSDDHGRGWILLWAERSPAAQTGYLAADPTDPKRLFVSVANANLSGLYRFEDAGTTTAPPVAVSGLPVSGALVAGRDGTLYVHQPPRSGSQPAQLSSSTDHGKTFRVVSDDFYRRANLFVNALAVDGRGRLYAALQGSGVTVGIP
jgi:hypothetical protein